MKVCQFCGTQIPDGEVFCPNCGEEVQLVPDFETMGSKIQEQKQQQQQNREDEILKAEQRKAERLREQRVKTLRRRKFAAAGIVILIIAVMVAFVLISTKGDSYASMYQDAQTQYENREYDKALTTINNALEKNPDAEDGVLLKGRIYLAMNDSDSAEETLLHVIEINSLNEEAYKLLIEMYEDAGDTDSIKNLMDACTEVAIRTEFDAYICDDPVPEIEAGSYDEVLTLTISCEADSSVYYTTDESEPSFGSDKYVNPLTIDEGTTVLLLKAINEKGIESNVVEAIYSINLDKPTAPKIYPVSGSYASKKAQKITIIVPNGYTAYYSFDARPTTESTQYTGPVDNAGRRAYFLCDSGKSER